MALIRSTLKVTDRFAEITAAVERLAEQAVNDAAETAAPVAQANASIDLKVEVVAARAVGQGHAGGIKSNRHSSNQGSDGNPATTPIALFFDQGTLGKRKKKLKQPGRREETWPVKRGDSAYTAKRGDIEGKGIEAELFFEKARTAGRKAMRDRINRGLL